MIYFLLWGQLPPTALTVGLFMLSSVCSNIAKVLVDLEKIGSHIHEVFANSANNDRFIFVHSSDGN